jgi:hypothetical protein
LTGSSTFGTAGSTGAGFSGGLVGITFFEHAERKISTQIIIR